MQLSAACQRVAALRATVPSQLTQRLTEHLQQCRPTGDIPHPHQHSGLRAPSDEEVKPTGLSTKGEHTADAASDAAGEDRTGSDTWTAHCENNLSVTPLSPAPADLQRMYVAAVQRMPALRYADHA